MSGIIIDWRPAERACPVCGERRRILQPGPYLVGPSTWRCWAGHTGYAWPHEMYVVSGVRIRRSGEVLADEIVVGQVERRGRRWTRKGSEHPPVTQRQLREAWPLG
jgi:hypothetical protein